MSELITFCPTCGRRKVISDYFSCRDCTRAPATSAGEKTMFLVTSSENAASTSGCVSDAIPFIAAMFAGTASAVVLLSITPYDNSALTGCFGV